MAAVVGGCGKKKALAAFWGGTEGWPGVSWLVLGGMTMTVGWRNNFLPKEGIEK